MDGQPHRQHPLLNSLIVAEIFRHLSIEDKKNYRRVSRVWRDGSLDLWRKSTVVNIGRPYLGQSRFMELFKDRNVRMMENGRWEPYYRYVDLPFRNYRIMDSGSFLRKDLVAKHTNTNNIGMWEHLPRQQIDNFWRLCGPQMEYLDMTSCLAADKVRLAMAFQWILTEVCPNLKTLCIDPQIAAAEYHLREKMVNACEIGKKNVSLNLQCLKISTANTVYSQYSSHNVYYEPLLSQLIVNLIPNIKELHFEGSAIEIIKALPTEATINRRYANLECLKLHVPHSSKCDEIQKNCFYVLGKFIEKVGARLKRVSVNMPRFKHNHGFQTFLHRCENTLTKLELSLTYDGMDSHLWFEEMYDFTFPNLTTFVLNFDETELAYDNFRFGDREKRFAMFSFRILRKMPQLQVFRCKSNSYSETQRISRRVAADDDGRFPHQEPLRYVNLIQTYNWTHKPEMKLETDPIKLDHLKELVFLLNYKLSAESWRKIGIWAKGLKTLEMIPDLTSFSAVTELWPDLEKLTVRCETRQDKETIQGLVAGRGNVRVLGLDY